MDDRQPSSKGPSREGLCLTAAPSGRALLLPEEAAVFDLALSNGGAETVSVADIDGNTRVPVVRALDAAGGRLLFERNGLHLAERIAGNSGVRRPAPLRMIDLAPGARRPRRVNLWSYHEPLGPGDYLFEAAQPPSDEEPLIVSERVPFSIERADVLSAALGCESSVRMASILAWIAAPVEGAPRLLSRLSGFDNHGTVQTGATDLGEVPRDARPSVSHIPPDGVANWLGWIAAVTPVAVELYRHQMTRAKWRSGPVALPITDAVAIPRFPDCGHAVFLATGQGAGGPALAGFVAQPGGPVSPVWSVPLAAPATRAVCAFGMAGPISVLYASDDGKATSLHRIDVDEAGRVIGADRIARTTPNELVALAVDMRVDAPPSFVILESNRAMPDRLALVRIPLSGAAPPIVPLPLLDGWPSVDDGGLRRVIPAADAALEIDREGVPYAALTDALGRLFTGVLDGSALVLVRDRGGARCPHVAVTTTRAVASCFTDDGLLFVGGGH